MEYIKRERDRQTDGWTGTHRHTDTELGNLILKLKTKQKPRNMDRGLFDQNSLDQNCVFSVDQKFHNQLIEFFETFQLIKKFDQLPKKNLRILAVD